MNIVLERIKSVYNKMKSKYTNLNNILSQEISINETYCKYTFKKTKNKSTPIYQTYNILNKRN